MDNCKWATPSARCHTRYDATSNRVSLTRNNGTASLLPNAVASAIYDAANEQTAFAGTTLTYDSNGNLTNDGVNTYHWDARNRLIGISGGTSATFTYDALDRRIAKTINGATSTFQYDGADVVTESGTTNASYLSTLNIDEPIVRQTSTGNEYYHADDLGSTLALTNDAGTVTTTYTYGPFGTTTINGTSTNPFQFTGRENDSNGLYYYRARYYSPSQSRFLSEDPLEFDAGDPNLYAYVFNNPTNFIDPTGEIKLPDPIKRCLLGMLKAAGIDLAKRKSAADPDTLADAAQGCAAGGNKSPNPQVKVPSGSAPGKQGEKRSKVPTSDPVKTDIGKFEKTTTVKPGDGPGQSRAEYVVIKNEKGETIRTYKDSYDRGGKWMGRTPLRGGPEGRPAN